MIRKKSKPKARRRRTTSRRRKRGFFTRIWNQPEVRLLKRNIRSPRWIIAWILAQITSG